MAAIPKAAKTGGQGGAKSGASYPKAPGSPKPISVPSDRGGRRIGPTHCTASGSTRTY